MNCIEMNCIEMNCIEMYCIDRWLWRYMHYVELISSIWFIFVILVSKCILRWQPTFITFAVYSITRCSLVGESQTEPVFTWYSTIGTVAISVHYTPTTCVLRAARIPLRPYLPSWYLNTHTGTSCQLMISKTLISIDKPHLHWSTNTWHLILWKLSILFCVNVLFITTFSRGMQLTQYLACINLSFI